MANISSLSILIRYTLLIGNHTRQQIPQQGVSWHSVKLTVGRQHCGAHSREVEIMPPCRNKSSVAYVSLLCTHHCDDDDDAAHHSCVDKSMSS